MNTSRKGIRNDYIRAARDLVLEECAGESLSITDMVMKTEEKLLIVHRKGGHRILFSEKTLGRLLGEVTGIVRYTIPLKENPHLKATWYSLPKIGDENESENIGTVR